MKSIAFFVLLFFQVGFTQQRTCGTAEKMKQIFADSILKKEYLEQQSKFQRLLIETKNTLNKAPQSTLKIPVAVHFPTANENDRACLIKLAQSQVNVLNKDFKGTNQDISKWKTDQSFYPGINTGSIDVEFVLATKNHPPRTDPTLVNDEPAVTVGYNFGDGSDSDARWRGYFNFLVKPLEDMTLGYSPVGGIVLNGDAVVIDNNSFGTITTCSDFVPESPFNLGRTVTHELGHFLNLEHTFGDQSGCTSSNTDNVSDTPKIGKPSFECPNPGSIPGCEILPALSMNYMDYTYDRCMYMITTGQSKTANAYLNSIKDNLKKDVFSDSPVRININTGFSVFENPNNGNFTIQFENYSPEQNIDIFDFSGRIVYRKKFISKRSTDIYFDVSIPNASRGIYYVKVKNDKNERSIFKVFVY